VAGSPYPLIRKQRRGSRSPHGRVDVNIHVQTSSSDFDSDSDTNSPEVSSSEASTKGKKVRFEDSPKPKPKSALKKTKSKETSSEESDSETSCKCSKCKKKPAESEKGSSKQQSAKQQASNQPKKAIRPAQQINKSQQTLKNNNTNQRNNINSRESHKTSKTQSKTDERPNQSSTKALIAMSHRVLRSARAEVVDREDVIEGPSDPKPNAFFDPNSGVLRVYHGNVYGNPYGSLFPASSNPMPVGTFRQSPNPYFYGMQQQQFPMMAYGPMATAQPQPHISNGNFSSQPVAANVGGRPANGSNHGTALRMTTIRVGQPMATPTTPPPPMEAGKIRTTNPTAMIVAIHPGEIQIRTRTATRITLPLMTSRTTWAAAGETRTISPMTIPTTLPTTTPHLEAGETTLAIFEKVRMRLAGVARRLRPMLRVAVVIVVTMMIRGASRRILRLGVINQQLRLGAMMHGVAGEEVVEVLVGKRSTVVAMLVAW